MSSSLFHVGVLGHSTYPLSGTERQVTIKNIQKIVTEHWQMYPDCTSLWSRGVPYGDLIVCDLLKSNSAWKHVYMYSPRNQSQNMLQLTRDYLKDIGFTSLPENLSYQPLQDLETIENELIKKCSAFIFVIRDSSEIMDEDRMYLNRIVSLDKPVVVLKTNTQQIVPLFEPEYSDMIHQAVMRIDPDDL